MKYAVAPPEMVDDAGNIYDTEETVLDLISHNAVRRKLCLNK